MVPFERVNAIGRHKCPVGRKTMVKMLRRTTVAGGELLA